MNVIFYAFVSATVIFNVLLLCCSVSGVIASLLVIVALKIVSIQKNLEHIYSASARHFPNNFFIKLHLCVFVFFARTLTQEDYTPALCLN